MVVQKIINTWEIIILSEVKQPFLGKHYFNSPVQSIDHFRGKSKILSGKIVKSFDGKVDSYTSRTLVQSAE